MPGTILHSFLSTSNVVLVHRLLLNFEGFQIKLLVDAEVFVEAFRKVDNAFHTLVVLVHAVLGQLAIVDSLVDVEPFSE